MKTKTIKLDTPSNSELFAKINDMGLNGWKLESFVIEYPYLQVHFFIELTFTKKTLKS